MKTGYRDRRSPCGRLGGGCGGRSTPDTTLFEEEPLVGVRH